MTGDLGIGGRRVDSPEAEQRPEGDASAADVTSSLWTRSRSRSGFALVTPSRKKRRQGTVRRQSAQRARRVLSRSQRSRAWPVPRRGRGLRPRTGPQCLRRPLALPGGDLGGFGGLTFSDFGDGAADSGVFAASVGTFWVAVGFSVDVDSP
jgi:hypothetical protein